MRETASQSRRVRQSFNHKSLTGWGLEVEHVRVLGPGVRKANELGRVLGIGAEGPVLVDEAVERAAARPPVQPQDERRAVWSFLGLHKPVVQLLVLTHREVATELLGGQRRIPPRQRLDLVCWSEGWRKGWTAV